jgi:DinB superfamily
MAKASLTIEQVFAILPETPRRLAAAAEGLAPAQLRAAPAVGEWSMVELLAHLRSCADVWGDCIATMLVEDGPTIRAVNPQAYVAGTDYPDLEFRPSLAAFIRQRDELLGVLEPLGPAEWERTATVTGAGAPLRRTVWFYAEWLARHERTHSRQIDATAAAVRAAGP